MTPADASGWGQPPASAAPAARTACVWRAHLPSARHHRDALGGLLSGDEVARAARFLRPDDGVSSILSRGILRLILGDCLAEDPRAIRFTYTPLGKPSLEAIPPRADGTGAAGLDFNVSHSGDWLLIAVARGLSIGVDVERRRNDLDVAALAARFFSPPEARLIAEQPDAGKRRLFYTLWTRKEAYVKALGKGLSMPLDGFTAPHEDGGPVAPHAGDAEWLFATLDVAPDYAAALVTSPPASALHLHDWRMDG